MTPTPVTRPSRSLSEVFTRPVPGRHLLAGGLLLGLAATPLAAAHLLGSDTPAAHADHAGAPSSSQAAPPAEPPAPPVPAAVRPAAARASRGAARTALPATVARTVPVGRTFSGMASWYGTGFQGQRTASGETFDTNDLTAASLTLPFGTRLRVCHGDRCVVVRVNDRGPYVSGRVLDLSAAARDALGFSGVAQVTATPVAVRRVPVTRPAHAAARPPAPARRAPVAQVPARAEKASWRSSLPGVDLSSLGSVATPATDGPGLDALGLALVGGSGAALAWARRLRA